MHMYIKALFKVAGKYAPSRNISFDIVIHRVEYELENRVLEPGPQS